MQLVKEHINFERGLDPKAAMTIGQAALDQKIYDAILDIPVEDSWIHYIDESSKLKFNYIKIVIPIYYFQRTLVSKEIINKIKNINAPKIKSVYRDKYGDVIIKLLK